MEPVQHAHLRALLQANKGFAWRAVDRPHAAVARSIQQKVQGIKWGEERKEGQRRGEERRGEGRKRGREGRDDYVFMSYLIRALRSSGLRGEACCGTWRWPSATGSTLQPSPSSNRYRREMRDER